MGKTKRSEPKTPIARYVVNASGRKTWVLLSVKDYHELIEDLHDLAVIAERRNEKAISLEEFDRRLRKHGIL